MHRVRTGPSLSCAAFQAGGAERATALRSVVGSVSFSVPSVVVLRHVSNAGRGSVSTVSTRLTRGVKRACGRYIGCPHMLAVGGCCRWLVQLGLALVHSVFELLVPYSSSKAGRLALGCVSKLTTGPAAANIVEHHMHHGLSAILRTLIKPNTIHCKKFASRARAFETAAPAELRLPISYQPISQCSVNVTVRQDRVRNAGKTEFRSRRLGLCFFVWCKMLQFVPGEPPERFVPYPASPRHQSTAHSHHVSGPNT